MDFQREPQSKHHLYCEQEKPAHCHGSSLLRLGTHPDQRRTQNQPTRYYDQADASYELGPRGQLGWGSGLALAIWVGLAKRSKKNNLRSKDQDDVWTVVLSESPWTANRRSRRWEEFETIDKNAKQGYYTVSSPSNRTSGLGKLTYFCRTWYTTFTMPSPSAILNSLSHVEKRSLSGIIAVSEAP